MERVKGRALVPGSARGTAMVSRGPLSLWGGLDPATGEVVDRRNELSGQLVVGRVLALPGSRGSSTTSNVLLEAIRAGTAPAAIITLGVDPMLALGSVVAQELYGRSVPVVALEEEDFQRLLPGETVAVYPDGTVEFGAR